MEEIVPVVQPTKKKKPLSMRRRIELERFLELYVEYNYNGTQAYCKLHDVNYEALSEKEKAVKRQQARRMFTDVHFTEMLAERQEYNATKYKLQRESVLDELHDISLHSNDEQNKIRAGSVFLASTQGATVSRQAFGASAIVNEKGEVELKIAIENTSGAVGEFNKATGYSDPVSDDE